MSLEGNLMTKKDKLFAASMFSAFTLWTTWCVLMAFVGSPFDQPILRAIVRFAVFVAPACFWLWQCETHERDKFGILTNSKQGFLTGTVVSFIWTIVHFSHQFQLPLTIHAWLNVIILSPVAEELLFRRVALNYAITKSSASKSIIASAIVFAFIHLPWWLISGEKTGYEIVQLLVVMFFYGLVFGFLYLRTKSLWSSLIPHSVNNFIALSIDP
jgi:membrane protease YdiL (CAAX protease family)